MWCEVCHCDTTARVSMDNSSLRCATCGSEIRSTATTAQPANLVHPHDVLARWARDELLSGPNRLPMMAPVQKLSDERNASGFQLESNDRVAASHSNEAVERHSGHVNTNVDAVGQPPVHRPVWQHSIEPADHSLGEQRATVDAQRAEWLSSAGQYLAYAGVAVLTVGGGIVLWSHFAAVQAATPTGWLLCLLGQMLLFLGVVTLVAAGLEQIRGEIRHQFQQIASIVERRPEINHGRESSASSAATTSATGTSTAKSPSSSSGDLQRRAG